MNRIHILKVPTVERKLLQIIKLYLETITLEISCKCSSKASLMLLITGLFQSQNKHCNKFCFNDSVPKIFKSAVAYSFSELCNKSCYKENVRHLVVRYG